MIIHTRSALYPLLKATMMLLSLKIVVIVISNSTIAQLFGSQNTKGRANQKQR